MMIEPSYNISFEMNIESPLEWGRVRIRTHRGQVQAFVVQYEAVIFGQRYPIVRYDCAHGFVHRDVLNHRGEVIDKQPLPEQHDLNVALQVAIAEMKAERGRFRAAFERRMRQESKP